MSTGLMVVIAVVVVAALAGLGFLLWTQARTQRLRRQYGPEYDHALKRQGSRRNAERELLSREHRHQELDIRPLAPRARELYRQEWTRVQERFVDAPGEAVEQADHLVTTVMSERGYPTKDFEERVATLSVEHARALDHYRRAHEISDRAGRQEASTEDLRQAMVHYRSLFEDLLSDAEGTQHPDHARDDDAARAQEAEGRSGPAEHRHEEAAAPAHDADGGEHGGAPGTTADADRTPETTESRRNRTEPGHQRS